MLATGIPILVIILVSGQIELLGEMYAFGLLGAFTLTCLGLDIVRYRDMKRARASLQGITQPQQVSTTLASADNSVVITERHTQEKSQETLSEEHGVSLPKEVTETEEAKGWWFKVNFALGILTTALVTIAWCTNLVAKPLATGFGVSVSGVGMIIAIVIHTRHQKEGKVPVPVVITRLEHAYPNATLAVLYENNPKNNAVVRAAVNNADKDRPLVFLYLAGKKPRQAPRMMEIIDPYLEDQQAKELFSKAEGLALKTQIPNRTYVYLQEPREMVSQVWQSMHPHDTLFAYNGDDQLSKDINPDRIRFEVTPDGRVAHYLKRW
jgi:hypothetical protein